MVVYTPGKSVGSSRQDRGDPAAVEPAPPRARGLRHSRKAEVLVEVPPSSIVAVGLTGYGNGLYLVDKDGAPLRNGILSPDQRAQGEVERARRAQPADAVGGTA